MSLNENVFNANKSDYAETPLILGKQKAGLFDTIHKRFPDIWELYEKQVSLEWSPSEFNFTNSIQDFETCDKSVYDIMIKTLAWQWEADSIFSRAIAPVFAPFITNSELWAAWLKVTSIEVVHSINYSEIVRNSFRNPKDVLDEILSVQESHGRIDSVAKVFEDGYEASHLYALGKIENDQDLYDKFMLMVLALYLGERVQFMSSFAITFAICETGLFQAVGKSIQKICQDEFEVHAQLDKVVFKHELQTERGKLFRERNNDIINKLICDVIESEFTWTNYLFSEGRSIIGLNEDILKQWVLYCSGDVIRTLKAEVDYTIPKKNPLKYMEHWINIGLIQPSPQEQDVAMYALNNMVRDDSEVEFDVDF
jgi:ribonucleoside-diphosphate reductase beta chain